MHSTITINQNTYLNKTKKHFKIVDALKIITQYLCHASRQSAFHLKVKLYLTKPIRRRKYAKLYTKVET